MVTIELQPPKWARTTEGLPLTDDIWFFTLIGYGEKGAVFYYSNDPESVPPTDTEGIELQNPYSFTDTE